MRYFALASDYDGTLAHHGVVAPSTLAALEKLRASGRKLLLVTGRELPELISVFPEVEIFDRVVGENGALLYNPATKQDQLLCEPRNEEFVARLHAHNVSPLGLGQAIGATWDNHTGAVLGTIRELGLELQVIFNKGSVMVLPSGVNKATGLEVALRDLGLSARNTVAVGDAENDHAFLAACGCGVAVANALPALKEHAQLVTRGVAGAGVEELIDYLLEDDLRGVEPNLTPPHRLSGTDKQAREAQPPPCSPSLPMVR